MLDIQLQCHTATRKMFIVSNLEEYRRSNLADRQKDDDDDDDGDDNNDDDDDDEGEARPGSQTRRRRRLGTARPPSSTHQPCESAGLARPLGGEGGRHGTKTPLVTHPHPRPSLSLEPQRQRFTPRQPQTYYYACVRVSVCVPVRCKNHKLWLLLRRAVKP